MRRIALVLTVGTMMAVLLSMAAAPAMAARFHHDHFHHGAAFEIDQDIDETGNVTLNTTVSSTGDNSNQCVAPLQFGNTGNLQNAQGFFQFDSTVDDVEFEGSSFEFTPSLTNTCNQSVEQAAAAG